MEKILIIANNADGLYIFRGKLITELISKGYSVFALTPFTSRIDELKSLGLTVIESQVDRRGTNPIKDTRLFFSYLKMIKKIRPDFIISYTIKPNIYGGLAARIKRVPYAANITGLGTAFQKKGVLKFLTTFLYKKGLKKAKCVFFENSSNASLFVKCKIVPQNKVQVLNGAGVDVDFFHYLPYPDDDEVVRFLFIGRIMKEKGINELFAAMKRLHDEGTKCHLTVVGSFEENYKESILTYEKEGWLTNGGYTNNVKAFISKTHCAILPSWHEGMANSNLESASCGRPIITSNIPGCKEAVVEGVTGFVCEPKDSNSLYKAMKQMICLSNDERAKMGISGRELMKSKFDKVQVVKKTLDCLEL